MRCQFIKIYSWTLSCSVCAKENPVQLLLWLYFHKSSEPSTSWHDIYSVFCFSLTHSQFTLTLITGTAQAQCQPKGFNMALGIWTYNLLITNTNKNYQATILYLTFIYTYLILVGYLWVSGIEHLTTVILQTNAKQDKGDVGDRGNAKISDKTNKRCVLNSSELRGRS